MSATWPDPCECLAGNEANGWHERRCAPCLAVEREQWARAMRSIPAIVHRVRESLTDDRKGGRR